MSDTSNPNATEFDEVSSQLTDGLKACRAIVSDYRAMLGRDEDEGARDPSQDNFQD